MEPHERQERALRFGCGACLGAGVGLSLFLSMAWDSPLWWLGAVALALVFGWLALRRGNRFWQWFLDSWCWWFP